MGSLVSSPKNTCLMEERSKVSRHKWIEESSFFMGNEEQETNKEQKVSKKDLTHSEAFEFEPESPLRNVNRKYSINLMASKNKPKSPSKNFYQVLQRQDNDNYMK